MKCPLLYIEYVKEGGEMGITPTECLKEDCAWWVENVDRCAIRGISLELSFLLQLVTNIAKKVPHEEQFGK